MSKVNPSFSNEIDIIPGPVLASTSRFRAAQLEQLGLPFDTVSPEIDETPLKSYNYFKRKVEDQMLDGLMEINKKIRCKIL